MVCSMHALLLDRDLRDDAMSYELPAVVAVGRRRRRNHRRHAVRVAVVMPMPAVRVAGSLHVPDDRRGLGLMRALEVARGDGVDDERGDGGQHGDEARERELLPRPVDEARRAELVEGVREDVHEGRGQDDPRGEGLDGEEEVGLRAEGREPPAERWDRAADGARDEDAEDGDDLERQRPRLVIFFVGGGLTVAVGDGEQRERGDDQEVAQGSSKLGMGSHLLVQGQARNASRSPYTCTTSI